MDKRLLLLFAFLLLIVGCNEKNTSLAGKSDNGSENNSDDTITIVAVTGELGTGASQIGNDSMWTASINLGAWRTNIPNSSIQKDEFQLEWLVKENELEEAMELLEANQIVKLQVTPPDKNNTMQLEHVLETNVSDDQLDEILNKQLEPVYFQDEQFGKFELDKGIDIFQNNVQWVQKPCYLFFNWHEDDKVMRSSLRTAYLLFEKQEEWDLKIKTFASDKLLDLANEWLADGDSDLTEITKELFINRMTIDSINVYPDGDFEMTFLDGDLFWGHTISVTGNVNGVFEDATISG